MMKLRVCSVVLEVDCDRWIGYVVLWTVEMGLMTGFEGVVKWVA